MSIPHAEFHEIWWIYSPVNDREWSGLRIAHFRKTVNGEEIVFITGEIDGRRIGARDWKTIQECEFWYKVEKIRMPTPMQIMAAAIDQEFHSRGE